jgi:hypothetical protein
MRRDISIFLFGDDSVELFEGEIFIRIGLVQDVGVVHHFHDLLVVHGFSEFSADSLDLLEVYDAFALAVVEVENFIQTFFGLGVPQLGVNYF